MESSVPLSEYLNSVKKEEKKQEVEENLQTCDICYEEYPEKDFFGLSCEHKFCKTCLSDHLDNNILEG